MFNTISKIKELIKILPLSERQKGFFEILADIHEFCNTHYDLPDDVLYKRHFATITDMLYKFTSYDTIEIAEILDFCDKNIDMSFIKIVYDMYHDAVMNFNMLVNSSIEQKLNHDMYKDILGVDHILDSYALDPKLEKAKEKRYIAQLCKMLKFPKASKTAAKKFIKDCIKSGILLEEVTYIGAEYIYEDIVAYNIFVQLMHRAITYTSDSEMEQKEKTFRILELSIYVYVQMVMRSVPLLSNDSSKNICTIFYKKVEGLLTYPEFDDRYKTAINYMTQVWSFVIPIPELHKCGIEEIMELRMSNKNKKEISELKQSIINKIYYNKADGIEYKSKYFESFSFWDTKIWDYFWVMIYPTDSQKIDTFLNKLSHQKNNSEYIIVSKALGIEKIYQQIMELIKDFEKNNKKTQKKIVQTAKESLDQIDNIEQDIYKYIIDKYDAKDVKDKIAKTKNVIDNSNALRSHINYLIKTHND